MLKFRDLSIITFIFYVYKIEHEVVASDRQYLYFWKPNEFASLLVGNLY